MRPTARVAARAVTWPLVPAALTVGAILGSSRPNAEGGLITAGDVPFLVALVACWLVGVVLTGRAFDHPASWAFLGLATALAYSSWTDTYSQYALDWHSGVSGGELVAVLDDTCFVWWFVFLALVLQFTPPSRRSPLPRWLPTTTIVAGGVYQLAALLRSTHLDRPREDLTSPLAVATLNPVVQPLATAAIIVVAICLIASAVRIVQSWRRSEGEERQQLLWLVAGTLPLVPCVIASFAVSYADHPTIAGYLMAAAIAAIASGAALSVLRYRLYDVEHVVTESAAYAIASAAVVVIFVVVVVVISKTTPINPGSQLPTVLATLAGAGVARVAYVWGRRAVAKRVNRERYDAVEAVRIGLRDASPDLDAVLATALGDPAARVVYPIASGAWATADGRDVRPAAVAVEVLRSGAVTARVEFDPGHSERSMVEAVAREAAAEIDNVSLRAELTRQVEVVTESRKRLATAQLEERRRIERDLHDGAQQRLLAIALQLQSAKVNGQESVLRDEVERAVAALGMTIQELRDLAAGLQPAALAGGGLLAAVVDLVNRIPVAIDYDVVDRRFAADVEGAAWFVVAEAVANAVKHADAQEISIKATSDGAYLRVAIADCGVGNADPSGHGLQGLADRVAALRGTLRVSANHPHGTVVEAELPCGS